MNRLKQLLCSRHLLMLLLLPFSFMARGQSLEPNYGAPATPLSVANGSAIFKIRINGGAACVGPRALSVTLPVGYVYVAGSASVTAGSGSVSETSSSGNTASLSVSSIPASPDSTIISYRAYAGCGVIGGSATTINYSLNGCGGTSTATATVNAQNAQLNITSVTNSAYVGALGDSYTRVITVTNDGLGAIDTIYLNSINTGGIAVTASVAGSGTLTTTATGYRITGATADGHLNNGESVTITETVSINTCAPGVTNFKAWYGPAGTECTVVSNSATAGATIVTTALPNIVLSVVTTPSMKCLPTGSSDGWVVYQAKNTSTATALFTSIRTNHGNSECHACAGAVGATAGVGGNTCGARTMYIDTAAGVTYSTNGGVTWLPLPYTVFQYWNTSGINSGKPMALEFLPGITELAPGDSVRVRFKLHDDIPSCCIADWYQANMTFGAGYTDVCGNNSRSATGVSSGLNSAQRQSLNSTSVADAVGGEPYYLTYEGFILKDNNSNRTDATGYIDYEITLPTSLDPSTVVADHSLTKGTTVLNPSSVTWDAVTRKLRLRFMRSAITTSDYSNWSLSVKTTVDCSGTGSTARLDVYSKLSACAASEWQVLCNREANFTLHGCIPDGCEGPLNYATKVYRTNYGIYSATNDGVPGGTLNVNNLRLDRTLNGDTVAVVTTAKMQGSSSFSNIFVGITKSEAAAAHSFVDATAYIYNASGTTTVTGITEGITSGTTPSTRVISVATGSGAPATYAAGDSIVVITRFRQLVSVDKRIDFTTTTYASNSIFFGDASQVSCDGNWTGTIYNFGAYAGAGGDPTLTMSECANNTATTLGQFQINPSAPSVNKHARFPYEIRSLYNLDTLRVGVPAGFEVTNLKVTVSGQNAAAATGIASYALLGSAVVGTTTYYYYDLSNLQTTFMGASNVFSEGFTISFSPTIKANCKMGNFSGAANIATVSTKFKYVGSSTWSSINSAIYLASNDLSYTPLSITSASPNLTVNSDTASWVIQLSNVGSIAKPNAWIAEGSGVNSISIYNVQELSGPGGTVVSTFSATGGIYQLGNIPAATSKYYRVNATFTNCTTDTTKLIVDYNCDAYPASISAGEASCRLQTLPVTVKAQAAALQLAVISQPSGTVDLCDVLDYEIEVTNSGLGSANTLSVRAVLPSTGGVEYVLGSYGIKSPSTATSYTSLADANVAIVGGNMVFTVPASTLASLPGTGKYKIKFQLKTTACDFTSGSRLVFRPSGRNGCSNTILGTAVAGNRINLNGVPPIVPAYTISSSATSVVACGSSALSSTYKFKLINTGSIPTESTDGYRITLPSGWSMNTAVTYSTAPPAGGAYSTSPAAGVYDFYTGVGLEVGDSIVFTTTLTADGSTQSCGLTEPIVESGFVQFAATCIDPGTVCNTKQLLEPEHASTTINVQRPSYSIGSIDLDEAATGVGSNVIGSLTLNHSNAVYTTQNVTISIYEDLNSNGVKDAGEPLMGSSSYPVANVASQSISFNIPTTVTAPSTKNLVAVATFECSCDTPQVSLLNVVLPITFMDEQVSGNECSVNLRWNYASSDAVVHHFSVERQSAKQGVWSSVATVPVTQLVYTDDVPYSGQWLYRIKAINSNNEQAYSRVLSVNTVCDNGSVTLFPNPASTECYVLLEGNDSGKVPYTVTDKLGRVVQSGNLTGNSKNRLDLGHLASGIYRIQFVYGNEQHVKAIDVVK